MTGSFDYWLSEFVREMRTKFEARHKKQHDRGNKSVLDSSFDFSRDLDPRHVSEHFAEEIAERQEAEFGDDTEKEQEDVDVANMAFLDWAMRKARR